jgi:hypothetical protein
MTEKEGQQLDLSEVLLAVVLGWGAVGAAVAGFQSGQWNGRMAEAYGEAATLTTKAATHYQEQIAEVNHDYSVDTQAKRATLEALAARDDGEREKLLGIAGRLYASYLSEPAQKSLALKPSAEHTLTAEQVVEALEHELDNKYIDSMVGEAEAGFGDADTRFSQGREANQIGDSFALDVVVYTIGLFFAGIAAVFASKMRYVLMGAAVLLNGWATVVLCTLKWA